LTRHSSVIGASLVHRLLAQRRLPVGMASCTEPVHRDGCASGYAPLMSTNHPGPVNTLVPLDDSRAAWAPPRTDGGNNPGWFTPTDVPTRRVLTPGSGSVDVQIAATFLRHGGDDHLTRSRYRMRELSKLDHRSPSRTAPCVFLLLRIQPRRTRRLLTPRLHHTLGGCSPVEHEGLRRTGGPCSRDPSRLPNRPTQLIPLGGHQSPCPSRSMDPHENKGNLHVPLTLYKGRQKRAAGQPPTRSRG
jgi:hypothetical protein